MCQISSAVVNSFALLLGCTVYVLLSGLVSYIKDPTLTIFSRGMCLACINMLMNLCYHGYYIHDIVHVYIKKGCKRAELAAM